MPLKLCALCGKEDPDSSMSYTYGHKRTIPHVLEGGQISSKEWTERTRKFALTLPIHTRCGAKHGLVRQFGLGIGILGPLLTLAVIAVQVVAPSLYGTVVSYASSVCGISLILTVAAWIFNLSILPWYTKKRVSAWLSLSDPQLWNELNSPW
jgi:hypothetical protein